MWHIPPERTNYSCALLREGPACLAEACSACPLRRAWLWTTCSCAVRCPCRLCTLERSERGSKGGGCPPPHAHGPGAHASSIPLCLQLASQLFPVDPMPVDDSNALRETTTEAVTEADHNTSPTSTTCEPQARKMDPPCYLPKRCASCFMLHVSSLHQGA